VYHGHGHLEKVYENALAHRLREAGLKVKQRHPIRVYDEDGTLIGDYVADLLVEDTLILERKTAKKLAAEHEAQILGYLKSVRLEHGCLSISVRTGFKSANSPGTPRGNERGRRVRSLRCCLRFLRSSSFCFDERSGERHCKPVDPEAAAAQRARKEIVQLKDTPLRLGDLKS